MARSPCSVHVPELARRGPQWGLTTLAQHIDIELLREAYRRTRNDGAVGVDCQTAAEYAKEANLSSLSGNAGRSSRLVILGMAVLCANCIRAGFGGASDPAGDAGRDRSVADQRAAGDRVFSTTDREDQSDAASASAVGCADGQREGFINIAAFPALAGCAAAWDGVKSMRAPRTGGVCGDDGLPCQVPGDACAHGWHVCGFDGLVANLRAITGQDCQGAGSGRFYAAVSHCATQPTGSCTTDPSPAAVYPCGASGYCSEAVCCGALCVLGDCIDGIWPGATPSSYAAMEYGCANTDGSAAGVMCCKD